MEYIVTTGFYGTGSSAFTDLLSEMKGVSLAYDGNEMRFLQDADGVRVLEFNILENNHRHNTSHAIKRFKKMCEIMDKKWYHKCVGDDFINATYKYIDNLTELKCDTYWHYDNFERGYFFKIISFLYFHLIYNYNKFAKNKLPRNLLTFTHEKGYFSCISEEEFYMYTRNYINEVFSKYSDCEYLLVDQLIPCSNVNHFLKYFDNNIKVIIVDRDPRDIYIEEAEGKYGVPPRKVEDFCEWFKIIRQCKKTEKYDEKIIMNVQFEDLIYDYKNTSKKVLDFIGINTNNHLNPLSKFNPEISIKNTNMELRYPQYSKEIEYIKQNLKEFLYNFDTVYKR